MIEFGVSSIAKAVRQHISHESKSNKREQFEQDQKETEVIAYSARTESTVTFIKTGASLYIIIKEVESHVILDLLHTFQSLGMRMWGISNSLNPEFNSKPPGVRWLLLLCVPVVPTSQIV